jgi:hypothetical protein
VLLVFRKPQHGKARYNDIQKKRANTRFSGLLTFTYFLCDAFFEWKYRTRCYKSRHSTPITASTMAFSSSPNRPTLGAHQQHSQAALPCSLWSNAWSAVSVPSILDRGRFVTFHEIETHHQNRIRSQHYIQQLRAAKPITIWPVLELHVDAVDGVLSFHQNKVARAFYTRWWSDCQVSWCVSKVYLLMFNPKLTNQSRNNLHLLKIPNDRLRCDLMSWGYWSRSSQLKQVFGFCEPRKKMFFGTRSTQQSAQQWCNNSTLMGWMFWVSLGTTSCWLERRIDRWFGIFFLAFHLDEAGNNEVQL